MAQPSKKGGHLARVRIVLDLLSESIESGDALAKCVHVGILRVDDGEINGSAEEILDDSVRE